MSWLIAVTFSCSRVPSIRKSRSSGCVIVAAEVRVEGRVEVGEQVRRDLLVVVERDRDVAAGPGQLLRDAGVVGGGVVLDDGAAVQLAGRRLDDGAMPVRRRHRRPVGGAQPFQVVFLDRRVEPLHGDVEVALERARRGLVERQLDVRPRRGDRDGGPRLIGGGPRGLELARGVARELVRGAPGRTAGRRQGRPARTGQRREASE